MYGDIKNWDKIKPDIVEGELILGSKVEGYVAEETPVYETKNTETKTAGLLSMTRKILESKQITQCL